MAKARPSASDSGSSNSPKAAPPSSTCRPSISGRAWSGRRSARRRPSRCRDLERGEGDLAGSGPSWRSAASGAARRGWRGSSPPRRRGLALDAPLVVAGSANGRGRRRGRRDRLDVVNSCDIGASTSGSSTPCSARNTIVPGMPAPKPPKCSSSTSRPWVLSTRALKSCPKAPPIALDDAAEDEQRRRPTITTTPAAAVKHHDTETSEHRDLRGVGSRRTGGRPPSTWSESTGQSSPSIGDCPGM